MALRIPEEATGLSRTDLSDHHRWSVEHLSRLAKSLEEEWAGSEISAAWIEPRVRHRAYVVGAILTSVAFLEATINETFSHAADTDWSMPFMNGSPRCCEALALVWSKKRTERKSTLQKYDLALRACDPPRDLTELDFHAEAGLVIEIRNNLVHYKPEWVPMPRRGANMRDDDKHPLQLKLAGRFTENPFTGSEDAFWPEKCLSAGCALWARRATEGFVDGFKRLLAASA